MCNLSYLNSLYRYNPESFEAYPQKQMEFFSLLEIFGVTAYRRHHFDQYQVHEKDQEVQVSLH